MTALKRKQIYLDTESARGLKKLSARTKISEAEHIRRAVQAYLAQCEGELREEEDPVLAIIGLIDDPNAPTDESVRHDYYLYGKPKGA